VLLDYLLKHCSLSLVIFEHRCLFVFKELLLFGLSQPDFGLAGSDISFLLDVVELELLLALQLPKLARECIPAQLCMSVILHIPEMNLRLFHIDHSLECCSSVHVREVFLQLEELLLLQKAELLPRCLIHGLVDNNERLFFVTACWSTSNSTDLGLKGTSQPLVDTVELILELLFVDSHLFLIHFVLLTQLDLKCSDLFFGLPGFPSLFKQTVLLQFFIHQMLLLILVEVLELVE